MACGMQPAAGATALMRSCGLPSPHRCAAAVVAKSELHQVASMKKFHWKLSSRSKCYIRYNLQELNAAESDRFRNPGISSTCSGSSTEGATSSSSRPANGLRDCVDAVPGARIVISGYWTGPDMDDGCGHVQAIVQRIA